MPRCLRVLVDGATYHVYCRAGRGERPFANGDEAEAFCEVLRTVKKRDGLIVLAWCLMPNHYHLVVRTTHVFLSRSMKVVQGRFAQAFNRRRRTIGSLWQERYKAKLVLDAAYFQSVVGYVHLNPVRAGLVGDPGEYQLCGHCSMLGKVRDDVLDVAEALALFGSTRATARRSYCGLIAAMKGDDDTVAEPGRLPWWSRRHAGEEPEANPAAPGPRLGEVSGVNSVRPRVRLDAARYVDGACRLLGLERSQLVSPRRDRASARARSLVCLLGVERYGVRTKDLALLLERTPDAVSVWTARGTARKATDAEFRQAYELLDEALSSEAAHPFGGAER